MLAAIRNSVDVPLDVWAETFESFGGMNRLWEAGDIARVAGPVYFKIEPGESEAVMYNGWVRPRVPRRPGPPQGPPRRDPQRAGADQRSRLAVSPKPRPVAHAHTN